MKVFIFHCWGGDSRTCWSPWLENELKKLGIRAINPNFPQTENPKLDQWLKVVRGTVPRFEPKDDWVLVSHSLGGPTIFRLLETFEVHEKVKAIIIVAGFGKDLGIAQIKNFVDKEFDWAKIKSKAEKIILISSDNDPYIELEEAKRIEELLGAKLIILHNAGHINAEECPGLVQEIKEL